MFKSLPALLVFSILFGCAPSNILRNSKEPAVVAVRSDAALAQAVKTAQATLPQFTARLKSSEPGARFAINARIAAGSTYEHIWVDHLRLEKGAFVGRLASAPVSLKDKHQGDEITVQPADVSDWLIQKNGKRQGGFTVAVLAPRQ